jgi:hypothetical protein
MKSDQHDAVFVVQGRHSADNEDPIYVPRESSGGCSGAFHEHTARQFMDETVQILHDISTLKGFYDKGLVKIIQGYKKGPGKTIKTPNNCPTMSEKYQQVSAGMVGDDNMIHVMCCYVSSALHQYWPQATVALWQHKHAQLGLTIMCAVDYQSAVAAHVEDTNTYQDVTDRVDGLIQSTCSKLKQLVCRYSCILGEKLSEFLLCGLSIMTSPAHFYVMPKLHKMRDLAGPIVGSRPIAACHSWMDHHK